MKYTRTNAFKEAVSDTGLAFVMNVPIGFGIIAFANAVGIVTVTNVENVQLVILQNIVFTTVAIIRKTYVRLYFNNRNLRKQAKNSLTT
jgi:hypothetical protein|tara:strand:+ start:9531 stop:9797 length:267 start_codon:yes stop_codon:yes gene_type:complete